MTYLGELLTTGFGKKVLARVGEVGGGFNSNRFRKKKKNFKDMWNNCQGVFKNMERSLLIW